MVLKKNIAYYIVLGNLFKSKYRSRFISAVTGGGRILYEHICMRLLTIYILVTRKRRVAV